MSFNILRSMLVPRLAGLRYAASNASGKDVAIIAAGDAFGRQGAAREAEYFLKKQREQILKLKTNQIDKEAYHQISNKFGN